MFYWKISRWIKKLYPDLIWDIKTNKQSIFVTFDDGPTPQVTEKVLDILYRFDAKATFFCIGRNVERHPDLFQEIKNRGHQVGNHSYSHIKGWKACTPEYIRDVELCSHQINSRLFRPPYGRIKKRQIRILKDKYRMIMWDVLSHDYNSDISGTRCLKSVLKYSRAGSIVVFHDSAKAAENVLFVLPRFLEFFAEKGFTFERIEL